MSLIDTDKIAAQFGIQTAKVVESIAENGLSSFDKALDILEKRDLEINTVIRLVDRK